MTTLDILGTRVEIEQQQSQFSASAVNAGMRFSYGGVSEMEALAALLARLDRVRRGVDVIVLPQPGGNGGAVVFVVAVPAMPTLPTTANTINVPADYSTIKDAFSAAAPNTTIEAANGHVENLTSRWTLSGKATDASNPIVIKAANSRQVTINNTVATDIGINVTSPHIWFDGLVIDGNNAQLNNRLLRYAASDCKLLDCEVANSEGHLIFCLQAPNLHIQGCSIHDSGLNNDNSRDAIVLDECDNSAVIDCDLYRAQHQLITLDYSPGSVVSFNRFRNCTGHSITTLDGSYDIVFNEFWNDIDGNGAFTDAYMQLPDVALIGQGNFIFVHQGTAQALIAGNTFRNSSIEFIMIKGDGATQLAGPIYILNNSGYGAGLLDDQGVIRIKSIPYAVPIWLRNNAIHTTSKLVKLELDTSGVTFTNSHNYWSGSSVTDLAAGTGSTIDAAAAAPFTDGLNGDFTPLAILQGAGSSDLNSLLSEFDTLSDIDIGAVQMD